MSGVKTASALVLTTWDARVFGRALAVGTLAFVVAWLVTAATDEGAVAWGVRAGRTLPMTPICAALGTLISLAPARAHGELRALAALGRAPWQNALGSALGGASTALVAATLMAASANVDVSGFFPVARHTADYRYEAGGFIDRDHGWRIDGDGSFTKLTEGDSSSAPPSDPLPPHARAAASLATALAGLALPMLAAFVSLSRPDSSVATRRARLARGSAARASIAVVASAGATVLLFHGAAATRTPALLAAVPPALLLIFAIADFSRDST